MADPKQVEMLRRSVKEWNRWRRENPEITPDLSRADLRQAQLHAADLTNANLERADLGRAILGEANLTAANLGEACLSMAMLGGARLIAANLSSANLRGANLNLTMLGLSNLSDADLRSAQLLIANLNGADLSRADLSEATCGGTAFANVDLSETKGLDSIVHVGPSTIGIDTIYKSGGKIPEIFLRGAGVPENFITFMGSLTAKAFEFYSCFISYSTKDEEFAERVYADLQQKGVRCWFAAHDMQGGRMFHEQIDEAIRLYDKLLLILSQNSIDSNWVTAEILKARRREKQEKRTMLFPVSLVPYEDLQSWECFDDDTGEDLAREIRKFHIPNFSAWRTDNDSYKREFEKLLRDLKSGEKQKV